jgi:hypothetical protein
MMDLSKITAARADDDFFYLSHSEHGDFKMAKRGLSPANRRAIENYCKGGEVKGYSGADAAANPAAQVVTPEDPVAEQQAALQNLAQPFTQPQPVIASDAVPAPAPEQPSIESALHTLTGESGITNAPAPAPEPPSDQTSYVDALLGRAGRNAPSRTPVGDQTAAALRAGARAYDGAQPSPDAATAATPSVDYMAPLQLQLQTLLSGKSGVSVPKVGPASDIDPFDKAIQQVTDAQDRLGDIKYLRASEEKDNAVRAQNLVQQISTDYTARIRQAQNDADKAFTDYLNTPFDPQRLFHKADTGSIILGAIGVALGGIGSGLRQEAGNPVMSLIDRAIERDIEAQKVDLGKKQSAVSYYVNKGLNLMQAMQMAKADAQDKIAAMAAVTAARYSGFQQATELQADAARFRAQSFVLRQQATAQAVQNQYQPALIQSQLANQSMERKTRELEIFERKLGLARTQTFLQQMKNDGGRDPWLMDRWTLQTDPKEAAGRQVTVVTQVPTGTWDKTTGKPITAPMTVRRFAISSAAQKEASDRLSNELKFNERANFVKEWIKNHPGGKQIPGEDQSAINGAITELKLSWPTAVENLPGANEGEFKEIADILGDPASIYQAGTGRTTALVNQLNRVSQMTHEANKAYLIPTREELGLH